MIRGQESEASSKVDFVIVREMKKNDVGKIENVNSDGLISNKNKFDEQNKISQKEQKSNSVGLIDEQNKNKTSNKILKKINKVSKMVMMMGSKDGSQL